MASPSSLKLLSPYRLWAVMSTLMGVLIVASISIMVHDQNEANQRLVERESKILIKARISDLEKEDYRAFVEGLRKNYSDVFIKIEKTSPGAPLSVYQYGQKASYSACSTETLNLGSVKGTSTSVTMCRAKSRVLFPIIIVSFVFLLLVIVALFAAKWVEGKTLRELNLMFKDLGGSINDSQNLGDLVSRINEIKGGLKTARANELKVGLLNAEIALSKKVAHDIKSPLTALGMIADNSDQVDAGLRAPLKSAVSRMRDIVADLSKKSRGHEKVSKHEEKIAGPIWLNEAIETIVREKQIQYGAEQNIKIEAPEFFGSQVQFVNSDKDEFQNIISNLVDNAIESYPENTPFRPVVLKLSARDTYLCLSVQDKGRGLSERDLDKVFEKGFTSGKANGSGLGLFYAKAGVESWGGSIQIKSEQGRGASVIIRLPIAGKPEWFCDQISLGKKSIVVVLDDDASIHEVWQSRMEKLGASEAGIQVVYFSEAEQLRNWRRAYSYEVENCHFFLDYHLGEDMQNGCELMEELGISRRSTLVTSHFDDAEVIARVSDIRTRMLPKVLLAVVDISLEGNSEQESGDGPGLVTEKFARPFGARVEK